jgi:hypothetical protein
MQVRNQKPSNRTASVIVPDSRNFLLFVCMWISFMFSAKTPTCLPDFKKNIKIRNDFSERWTRFDDKMVVKTTLYVTWTFMLGRWTSGDNGDAQCC